MTKIDLKVESLMPDPTNYKVMSVKYAPEDLIVEVEIPDEEVIENIDKVVLTEKGITLLMTKLAQLANDANENYLHTKLPK